MTSKTSKPTARRRLQMFSVAENIADDWLPGAETWDECVARARATNSGDGFTIRVRYGGESPGSWTETSGLTFSDDEMGRVLAAAEIARVPTDHRNPKAYVAAMGDALAEGAHEHP